MDDWKEQISAHWELINRMAGRRFADQQLAEEAALFVMDGLAANDGHRLRSYTLTDGQSHAPRPSLRAYIGTLTARLLEDFSRKRFGRRRPPAWLTRLGSPWPELYRLLCLERFSLVEAVELAATKSRLALAELESAAGEILGRIVDCGAHQYREQSLADDGPHQQTDFVASQAGQVSGLEAKDKAHFLQLLFGTSFHGGTGQTMRNDAERLLRHDFELSDQERLLLTLCYVDDLPVSEAGRRLGLNRFQCHGRLKRLLRRLRDDIERFGLGEELLNLLR